MAPYAERIGDAYHRPRPIDIRYMNGDPISRQGNPATKLLVRRRAADLPDDPLHDACDDTDPTT